MRKLCTYGIAAALLLAAVPRVAGAQVYPDRVEVKAKNKHVVDGYQRRDREDNREQQTERIAKTVKLGADGSLDIGNIAGDITVVKGGSGTEATIEAIKTARARTVDEAKQQLQAVQVDIVERPGRAEVKARYPRGDENWHGRNINVSVAYNIAAPAGTALTINTISGDVKVTDIKGEITAASVSGDVRILNGARISAAKSVSGSIEITDVQTDGSLDAGSVSGDVVIRKATARRLELSSVSGNVQVDDAQCERVTAHSTSGNIAYGGALAKGGRYELKSFSGDVRLAVAGSTGFEVEASSFSGEVRPELELQLHNAGADNARRRRTAISGTYGDGSAVVQITTFSGRIVIARK